MQPNNPSNLPRIQPQQTTQQVTGIDNAASVDDNIFLVKPPENEPVDKKSIGVVVAFTVLGVIVLVAILVFALIGSADGLARDYRRLAAKQVLETGVPLNDLSPELVINKRNINSAVEKIDVSEQSQPTLDSVLFVGEWSGYYKKTEELQNQVAQYYKKTNTYIDALKLTLEFDAKLQEIAEDEPALIATINPDDTLTIRSLSGSYATFAKNIEKIKVSSELTRIKKEVVEAYARQSSMYLTYAKAVESKDAASIEKVKIEIAQANAEATVASEDQVYIRALSPSYKQIDEDQQKLVAGLRK